MIPRLISIMINPTRGLTDAIFTVAMLPIVYPAVPERECTAEL